MKKNVLRSGYLLLAFTLLACQHSGENDDKTLASTHPKLEKQLGRDSVRTPITSGDNPGLYQRYRISMEEFEKQHGFMVEEKYNGELAPLDLDSHSDARKYKAALLKGMKEGINYAGKYTVVTVGCGAACQLHFVINRKTGKITDNIQSSTGAKYHSNSRTFILNPPDSTINYAVCDNCKPEAHTIVNGKFRKVSTAGTR